MKTVTIEVGGMLSAQAQGQGQIAPAMHEGPDHKDPAERLVGQVANRASSRYRCPSGARRLHFARKPLLLTYR